MLNACVRKAKRLKVHEPMIHLKKSENNSKTNPPKRRELIKRREFYEIKTNHILKEINNVLPLNL